MKVISQDGAIATIVFISDEVRPLKGYHLPALLKAIGERYGTGKTPSLDDARSVAAKFENGILLREDREIPIQTFSLYNDGITVTTTDTSDSEFVLNDIFAWLKQEFGLRDPVIPPVRMYQSDLVVKFDNDPANAFGALSSFIEFIQDQMTPPNAPAKKPVQFGYISFGADPSGIGATPEFTIARRTNVRWNLGHYFSKAHMQTVAHIKALEMLDGLLRTTR